MTIRLRLDGFFAKHPHEYFGIVGCGIIAVACVITAIGFTGYADEPYSMFNHFISELGFVGESELAWVFNVGLIVGAPIVGIFLVGTRATIPSRLGGLGRIIGIVTAIGGAGVGVFPADVNIIGHGITAMTFFFGGCLTVGIFSLAIFLQKEPRVNKRLSLLGAGVVFSFAAFLSILFGGGNPGQLSDIMGALSQPREPFMLTAFLEWLPLLGVLAWITLTALDGLKRRRNQIKT